MLEIQSRPGVSPSGLQALSHWADLEERAAKRLLEERLNLINIARETQDNKQFERLTGWHQDWENPLYMKQPDKLPEIVQSLSNLQKIDMQKKMMSGVFDSTTPAADTERLKDGKYPGQYYAGGTGLTGKLKPGVHESYTGSSRQAPADVATLGQQDALDILLSLKKAGVQVDDKLILDIANINNYGADKKNTYGVDINKLIVKSKDLSAKQAAAMQKYNANPNRHNKYINADNAEDMRSKIVKSYYDVLKNTADVNEIRKSYALANSTIRSIDAKFPRPGKGAGVDLYLPPPPGGGGVVKTREVEVTFEDGEILKFPVRKNLQEGKSLEKYITDNFEEAKGRKIVRTQLVNASRQLDPGEMAESMNKVQELINKVDSENLSTTARFRKKAKLAQQYGYTLNMETEKLNPLTDEDYAVRGSSKSTFADKVKEILGINE
jgi:hypothetical protein